MIERGWIAAKEEDECSEQDRTEAVAQVETHPRAPDVGLSRETRVSLCHLLRQQRVGWRQALPVMDAERRGPSVSETEDDERQTATQEKVSAELAHVSDHD